MLHRLSNTSAAYWEGRNRLRAKIGGKLRAVLKAVSRIMARTPQVCGWRTSTSRLRNYFTLRRHPGNAYLDLLQFFLNHRRYIRSSLAERVGKSRRASTTGEHHPHWLTLLGLRPLQNQPA